MPKRIKNCTFSHTGLTEEVLKYPVVVVSDGAYMLSLLNTLKHKLNNTKMVLVPTDELLIEGKLIKMSVQLKISSTRYIYNVFKL